MLRYSTLRLMCALAAMLGRKLYTSDAVQAYPVSYTHLTLPTIYSV